MPSPSKPTLVLAAALLAGCAIFQKPEPKPAPERKPPRASVVLRIKATPDLNPNDLGEPTPVDLRVYQLRDRPTFTEAAFEELWVKDKEVLGSALLGEPTTLNFLPQTAEAPPQAYELKLDPNTQFLGLMGLFSAERKEGIEERKMVVSVDEAAIRVIKLAGHRVEVIDPAEVKDGSASQDGGAAQDPNAPKDGAAQDPSAPKDPNATKDPNQ